MADGLFNFGTPAFNQGAMNIGQWLMRMDPRMRPAQATNPGNYGQQSAVALMNQLRSPQTRQALGGLFNRMGPAPYGGNPQGGQDRARTKADEVADLPLSGRARRAAGARQPQGPRAPP